MAVIVSAGFISLYLPIGPGSLQWPYEWGMILIWSLIGVVLATIAKHSYKDVTDAEREYLMFGEEYARKEILKNK